MPTKQGKETFPHILQFPRKHPFLNDNIMAAATGGKEKFQRNDAPFQFSNTINLPFPIVERYVFQKKKTIGQ